jgi:magnesium transporter
MIHSYIFSEGKLVGQDLEPEALKIILADKGLYLWVDLFDPTQEEVKLILVDVFNFHPLTIEDCVNDRSLPKVEDYEDYLFAIMHAVDFSRKDQFKTSEIDLYLNKEYLVTCHKVPLRAINSTFERIQKNSQLIARTPDRLMHTILDAVTKNYQPVIDELSEEIQRLEDDIFSLKPPRENVEEFLFVRKEVHYLRQIIHPQVEVVRRLAAGDMKMIRSNLLLYYRDLLSQLHRIEDMAHGFNEQLYLAMDVFLNKSQMQTNEIIKVLTILTAVTTPLMVIGTWYGMNFENIPELHGPHAYHIAAGVMIACTGGMIIYMRCKKWI